MERNRFTELFDNTGTSRVLDVLICGREFDYAITDLSRATGMNRVRLKQILEHLKATGIIYETRKLSRMQMYRLSGTHIIATQLTALHNAVIEAAKEGL
jgi:hypothetical protein